MSIYLKTVESLVHQEDWNSLISYCNDLIHKAIHPHKEKISIELAEHLIKNAIKFSQDYKFNTGLILRNAILSMSLVLPPIVDAQLTYDYLNYTSCALREKGHLVKAKILTEKALHLSTEYGSLCKSTGYMNMCAVLSGLGKHDKALHYAKWAVEVTHKELEAMKKKEKNIEVVKEKFIILAIAYFNLGTEKEYFENYNGSLLSFEKSYKILERYCNDRTDLIEQARAGIRRIRLAMNPKSTTPIKMKSNIINRPLSRLATPLTGQRHRTVTPVVNKSISNKTDQSLRSERKIIKTSESVRTEKFIIKVPSQITYDRLKTKYKDSSIEKDSKIDHSLRTDDGNQLLIPFVESRSFDDKRDVGKIIKIQSHFRGFISRNKQKLLEIKEVRPIYRRWKLMNATPFLITITKHEGKLFVKAATNLNILSLDIEIDLGYSPPEIYSRLGIYSNNLILQTLKFPKRLVYTGEISTESSICIVDYYMTREILEIEGNYNNSKIITEILLPWEYSKAVVRYIIDHIHPYVKLKDGKLVVASQSKFYSSSIGYILLKKISTKVEVMLSDESVEYLLNDTKFSISPIPQTEPIPLILLLKSKKEQFTTRPLSKVQLIFNEKILMNTNYEYQVRVFCIDDRVCWYYFEASADNSPGLLGNCYAEKDLKAAFKVRNIKKSITNIIKRITAVRGTLVLQSNLEPLVNFDYSFSTEKIIVKLQAIYRGNRTRDVLRLIRHSDSLLISTIKTKNKIEYQIKIYKISTHLLIEVSRSDVECFYKFIEDPLSYVTRFYRFTNIKLIADAIKLESLPSITTISGMNQPFCVCTYDIEELSLEVIFENRPKESLLIMCTPLPNKSAIIKAFHYDTDLLIWRKFNVTEILSIVGKYNIDDLILMIRCTNDSISTSELQIARALTSKTLNEKIVYRTCIKIMGVLYQVNVYLNENSLKFTYRRGSYLGLGIDFEIDLETACKKTGFSQYFLIPMINFMIKHLLIMRDDEIVMDISFDLINLDRIVCKLQSAYRSYKVRKAIKHLIHMRLRVKVKKPMENEIFTVMVFEKFDRYVLSAVSHLKVFSKYIMKPVDSTPEFILKSNINDLFIMHNIGVNIEEASQMRTRRSTTFITASSMSRTIIWEGKVKVDGKDCSIFLYSIAKWELLECHLSEKVLAFEIDSNHLPHDITISKKLQINQKSELSLKIKQKKIIFLEKKMISDFKTQVLIYTRKGENILLIFMIKQKRYIVKSIDKNANITKLMHNLRIFNVRENYLLSF